MHFELGEPAFANWYTSDPLIDVAKILLDCQEDDLQMELFNLLINPLSHDFALVCLGGMDLPNYSARSMA